MTIKVTHLNLRIRQATKQNTMSDTRHNMAPVIFKINRKKYACHSSCPILHATFPPGPPPQKKSCIPRPTIHGQRRVPLPILNIFIIMRIIQNNEAYIFMPHQGFSLCDKMSHYGPQHCCQILKEISF